MNKVEALVHLIFRIQNYTSNYFHDHIQHKARLDLAKRLKAQLSPQELDEVTRRVTGLYV